MLAHDGKENNNNTNSNKKPHVDAKSDAVNSKSDLVDAKSVVVEKPAVDEQATNADKRHFQACLIGTSMVKHINPKLIFDEKKTFFKSIGGGLITNIHEFLKKRDGLFDKCKCFLITCGSNDCDSVAEIGKTIENMIELAQYLSNAYPAANLFFNKLVPRTKTKYTELDVFDKKRVCFNNFLESTLTLMVPCKIISHEGFESKDELDKLLYDGVHLSPMHGVPLYIDEIKKHLHDVDQLFDN